MVCLGLFTSPDFLQAQAITQPDIKGFFRFERFGARLPLGINVVRQLDDVLLLGANREFVRSIDSGRTWQPVLASLKHKNVTTIVVDDKQIVVGTATGGLYRSTDLGLYWENFGKEPGLRRVRSLIRAEKGYIAINDSGVCFSRRDKDSTWSPVTLPSRCLDVAEFDDNPWFICENGSLIVDEGDGPIVKANVGQIERAALVQVDDFLALVLDSVVRVFDDDADSLHTWPLPFIGWTACIALHNELLLGGRSMGLRKLNLESGQSSFVFAGPAEIENISALALSGDSLVIGTSKGAGRCYVVSMTSPQWHALNPNWIRGTFDVSDLKCVNGMVFVATREEGVHTGRVADAQLFPIHDAYEQTIFTQLEPWLEEVLVVSLRAGIWRMKSGTGRPEWISRTLPPTYEYNATAIGTRILAGLSGGKVFWSDDEGKTWTQSRDTLPTINRMNTVANSVYISTVKGLYRSDDRGKTWLLVDAPFQQHDVLWSTGVGDILFVTSTQATYMYTPAQGFKQLEPGFTPGMMKHFTTILLHDGLLFATGAPAVYASSDLGETWQSHKFADANAAVSQFFYNGFYYVFTDRGDMWRSPIP